jgi:hypothetical protein
MLADFRVENRHWTEKTAEKRRFALPFIDLSAPSVLKKLR